MNCPHCGKAIPAKAKGAEAKYREDVRRAEAEIGVLTRVPYPELQEACQLEARKVLTKDEYFFYEHAGWSYDPKKETNEQGKIRCAKGLARAEVIAKGEDFYFEWSDDWSVGSHVKEYGEDSGYRDGEPQTCEQCVLFDRDGKVLASLGCIDDADGNYRRVIEAELAAEGVERWREEGARVNA